MLAAIAARTSTINLGLLVGGVTYRNPALVAKITTTIDIISGGRAVLGLGAAWFEDEHSAYGFDFPPLKERFERLEDALQITRAMFTAGRRDVRGQALPRRRRVQQPEADPRRHPDPDRRQRRAQDAAVRGQVRRRLEPLRRRRARQAPARRARGPLRGRRPRPGRDHQDPHGHGLHRAARTRRRTRRSRRRSRARPTPTGRGRRRSSASPDEVAEQVQAYLDAGLDGVTVSMPDVLRPRDA